MKIPPFSVAFPLLLAASLLAVVVFQGCAPLHPTPIMWQELSPVPISPPNADTDAKKKAAFKRALRHGKRSKTKFCVRGKKCEVIPSPTLPWEGASVHGEQKSSESAHNVEGGGKSDAVHVTQQVEFAAQEDKDAFLAELGLE